MNLLIDIIADTNLVYDVTSNKETWIDHNFVHKENVVMIQQETGYMDNESLGANMEDNEGENNEGCAEINNDTLANETSFATTQNQVNSSEPDNTPTTTDQPMIDDGTGADQPIIVDGTGNGEDINLPEKKRKKHNSHSWKKTQTEI